MMDRKKKLLNFQLKKFPSMFNLRLIKGLSQIIMFKEFLKQQSNFTIFITFFKLYLKRQLKDKDYEEMINTILGELEDLTPFSKRTHTFIHLVNICIEIMKINAERIEKVWEKICILLKLGFSKDKLTQSNQLLL